MLSQQSVVLLLDPANTLQLWSGSSTLMLSSWHSVSSLHLSGGSIVWSPHYAVILAFGVFERNCQKRGCCLSSLQLSILDLRLVLTNTLHYCSGQLCGLTLYIICSLLGLRCLWKKLSKERMLSQQSQLLLDLGLVSTNTLHYCSCQLCGLTLNIICSFGFSQQITALVRRLHIYMVFLALGVCERNCAQCSADKRETLSQQSVL